MTDENDDSEEETEEDVFSVDELDKIYSITSSEECMKWSIQTLRYRQELSKRSSDFKLKKAKHLSKEFIARYKKWPCCDFYMDNIYGTPCRIVSQSNAKNYVIVYRTRLSYCQCDADGSFVRVSCDKLKKVDFWSEETKKMLMSKYNNYLSAHFFLDPLSYECLSDFYCKQRDCCDHFISRTRSLCNCLPPWKDDEEDDETCVM